MFLNIKGNVKCNLKAFHSVDDCNGVLCIVATENVIHFRLRQCMSVL